MNKLLKALLQCNRMFGIEYDIFDALSFPNSVKHYNPAGKFMYGSVHIGNSNTLFCCHLDTVENRRTVKKELQYKNSFVSVKNGGVLGADDGAGIYVLCRMIQAKIPGHYFFFAGEECGGIGSSYFAAQYDILFPDTNILRAIAFDRKGTDSIITHQFGRCCSDVFATALAEQLGMWHRPDPTGVFTDTANMVSIIPECTNISVGYYYEHSKNECLDVVYLEQLCSAVMQVDWENLPTHRTTYDLVEKDAWWDVPYYFNNPAFEKDDTVMAVDKYCWYCSEEVAEKDAILYEDGSVCCEDCYTLIFEDIGE